LDDALHHSASNLCKRERESERERDREREREQGMDTLY
jgi:hypothetical protein